MRKHFTGYRLFAAAGLLLCLAETAYFGWNMTAQSGPEKMLDSISSIMIGWGIAGDVLARIKITRNITKRYDIKTDRIVFENGKEILHAAVKKQAEQERQDLIDRLGGKPKSEGQA